MIKKIADDPQHNSVPCLSYPSLNGNGNSINGNNNINGMPNQDFSQFSNGMANSNFNNYNNPNLNNGNFITINYFLQR